MLLLLFLICVYILPMAFLLITFVIPLEDVSIFPLMQHESGQLALEKMA